MKKKIKGIILAGGKGTRLFPLTKGTSKQLLPVYDKPMIYYPLSVLMDAGIREILIISTSKDLNSFKDLFGDGKEIGLSIQYSAQQNPNGIAEAFIIGEKFIMNDNVCLILGDNIFHGKKLNSVLNQAVENITKKNISTIFGFKVNNPIDFGVLEFDKNDKVISIEEKPLIPKSNYAVVGMYFYTNDIIKIAKHIKPSKRNELEITDINNMYIYSNNLEVIKLDKSFSWLDTGTFDSLVEATEFVKMMESKNENKIGCIEQIAYEKGYINLSELKYLAKSMENSSYGRYLFAKYKSYKN